jgi:TonB family protein
MLNYLWLMLALSDSGIGRECAGDHWLPIINETEALVEHRAKVVIPPDGFVAQPLPACVRVTFKIDGRGVPFDVAVSRSSRVRSLDMGALQALKGYRFRPPSANDREFSLVFAADKQGVRSP